MNSPPQKRNAQTLILPPLTPATIQRAREGLSAALHPQARQLVCEALAAADTLSRGGDDGRLSGEVRRKALHVLIRSLFRVRVENPERIPASPALLAPNHLNHIDPFLILSEIPASPYYYIMGDARTLYNKCWKRLLLRLAKGVIPLDRLWKEEIAVMEGAETGANELSDLAFAIAQHVPTGSSVETLRRLDRAVQAIFARGDGILIFPEGRLGTVEGELCMPLKKGAVIYALRSGVPIVPVALTGTQNLYFRKELTIRFGEPLIFPRSPRPKPREVFSALDAWESALRALLPVDYREPNEPKLFRDFLNRMFW